MSRPTDTDHTQITLRLPTDMRARLRKIGNRENRSLNYLICDAISSYLALADRPPEHRPVLTREDADQLGYTSREELVEATVARMIEAGALTPDGLRALVDEFADGLYGPATQATT